MLASASFPGWAFDQLRRIGRAVVDGVLPPRCLACGEIVEEPHALCSRCWGGITFFAPPWCVLCGLPFPHPMGEDALCGGCASKRPAWDQARAVLRYDKNSRRLVLGLKHGDRTHIAAALGGGCTAAPARCSLAPISSSRCRCTGPGSFCDATTRPHCSPRRCAPPGDPRSQRIGWSAAGESR